VRPMSTITTWIAAIEHSSGTMQRTIVARSSVSSIKFARSPRARSYPHGHPPPPG